MAPSHAVTMPLTQTLPAEPRGKHCVCVLSRVSADIWPIVIRRVKLRNSESSVTSVSLLRPVPSSALPDVAASTHLSVFRLKPQSSLSHPSIHGWHSMDYHSRFMLPFLCGGADLRATLEKCQSGQEETRDKCSPTFVTVFFSTLRKPTLPQTLDHFHFVHDTYKIKLWDIFIKS